MDWDQKTIRVFFLGSLCALLVFIWAIIAENRGVNAAELREVQQRQQLGTECIIQLLTDHRLNTHDFHEQSAREHGFPLNQPAPPPLPATVVPQVCSTYLVTGP